MILYNKKESKTPMLGQSDNIEKKPQPSSKIENINPMQRMQLEQILKYAFQALAVFDFDDTSETYEEGISDKSKALTSFKMILQENITNHQKKILESWGTLSAVEEVKKILFHPKPHGVSTGAAGGLLNLTRYDSEGTPDITKEAVVRYIQLEVQRRIYALHVSGIAPTKFPKRTLRSAIDEICNDSVKEIFSNNFNACKKLIDKKIASFHDLYQTSMRNDNAVKILLENVDGAIYLITNHYIKDCKQLLFLLNINCERSRTLLKNYQLVKKLIRLGLLFDDLCKVEHGNYINISTLKLFTHNSYEEKRISIDKKKALLLMQYAIKQKRVSIVKFLIKFDTRFIHTTIDNKYDAMEYIIRQKPVDIEFLKVLIESGANVNYLCSDGSHYFINDVYVRTMLTLLIPTETELEDPNSLEAIKLLLNNNADPNVINQHRNSTALSTALYRKHYKIATIIASAKQTNLNLNFGEEDAICTILMHYARKGDVKAVQILLANGADPMIKNGDGYTAIEMTRNPQVFLKFIEFHPNLKNDKELIKRMLKNNSIVNLGITKLLVKEMGCDVNTIFDLYGKKTTLLLQSLKNNVTKECLIEFIKEFDVNLNLNIPGVGTPLIYATYHKKVRYLEILVENGACVNAVIQDVKVFCQLRYNNYTALSIALVEYHKDCANKLLDLGATLKGKWGRIALYGAMGCDYKPEEMLQILSEKGLNHTPLQYCEDVIFFGTQTVLRDFHRYWSIVGMDLHCFLKREIPFIYNLCENAVLLIYSLCLRNTRDEKKL